MLVANLHSAYAYRLPVHLVIISETPRYISILQLTAAGFCGKSCDRPEIDLFILRIGLKLVERALNSRVQRCLAVSTTLYLHTYKKKVKVLYFVNRFNSNHHVDSHSVIVLVQTGQLLLYA